MNNESNLEIYEKELKNIFMKYYILRTVDEVLLYKKYFNLQELSNKDFLSIMNSAKDEIFLEDDELKKVKDECLKILKAKHDICFADSDDY